MQLRDCGCSCERGAAPHRERHAADRAPAPRAPARRAPELARAAGRATSASSSSPTGTRSPPTTTAPRASATNSSRWCSTGSPRGIDPDARHDLRAVGGARARRAAPAAVDDHAARLARAHPDLQGARSSSSTTAISRPTASSAIRCCRPPTSSCTAPRACRSASIRCRTSSSPARSRAASTTSTARSFPSRRRCSPTPRASPASTAAR